MCDKNYLIATLGVKMNKRMKQIQNFNNQLDKGINIFTNNIHARINKFWDETY
jgi:preprotein translocase subunit YajC